MIYLFKGVVLLLISAFFLIGKCFSQKKWSYPSKEYNYEFPRDHGSHPSYKIEWWYITGHLQGQAQERFGFESTFFRIGQESTSDIYLAHMAITDINNQSFYHAWGMQNEIDRHIFIAQQNIVMCYAMQAIKKRPQIAMMVSVSQSLEYDIWDHIASCSKSP